MATFTIEELNKALNGALIQKGVTSLFSGISTDTRTIKKGDVFIALLGENFDGHEFIDNAINKGAAGIIISNKNCLHKVPKQISIFYVNDTKVALENCAYFHRNRFLIPVIGVTGSNGKTTTKDMIFTILNQVFSVCSTVKNNNNEIGMCQTLLSLKKSDNVCIVEMGMRGIGQIKELCTFTKPTIGVVTNVGTSHIGILGSKGNIAKAKSELIESLGETGIAVLNQDDPLVIGMQENFRGKVLTYGIKKGDVHAENISYGITSTSFDCHIKEHVFSIELPVLGVHNVYNALASIAVGYLMGVETSYIQRAFQQYKPAEQRQHIVNMYGVQIMDDSYNANPLSMEMAFQALKQLNGVHQILVLGDMLELGEKEKTYHYETGKRAAEIGVDTVITVGELGKFIALGAKEHGCKQVISCNTLEEAAQVLESIMKKGDTVLLKASHSMHMEKILQLLGGDGK